MRTAYFIKTIFYLYQFQFFFLKQKENIYSIALDEKNLKFNFMINSTGLDSPNFHKKN